jgi:hypothetical protein
MKKVRSLVVLIVILTLAAGVFYTEFNRAGSVPAPLVLEGGELASVAALPSAPNTTMRGPFVSEGAPAASFDGKLTDLPQVGPAEKKPMREMASPLDSLPAVDGSAPDALLQAAGTVDAMPALGVSFAGLDLQNYGAGWPPDTNGDVGPNHYIQTVNTSIGIYTKTGAALSRVTFNTLFTGTGTPCDDKNMGDPVALYDHYSGRWILTDFAWSSTRGPFYECIAVSKTADPVAGGWWFYALMTSSNQLNDYPKLGVWPDGIYMSANMFTRAKTYAGVKVWAINRDNLINGLALKTVAFTLGTSYFSLIPSTDTNASRASLGTPNYFLSNSASTTAMQMWKFTVNWITPTSSTFTGPTTIPVTSFARPTTKAFVPQLGTTEKLDTLGDRLMVQLQYRNVSGTPALWVTHSVLSNNVTGIRWYEIRGLTGTPAVYQSGTYQPDSNHRWMGSIAADKMGNAAVGYSVSSTSMYPAIRYAGRLVTDAINTLGQGEATLVAGTGSQSGGYNRWGDYSAMTLDPDGCTFWYTTEYYITTSNNWQTRIASFKFPTCTP